jgi:hypothetical protein
MPTPFMHLQIAERILADVALPKVERDFLEGHLPAFYLGNVAPDYQTISSIPREKTHFYSLPPASDADACRTMLSEYPQLNYTAGLSPANAVFIAAYCSHLLLDLLWYREILIPVFLGPGDWDDHRHRFIVHNTLLTYLDKQAFDSLPDSAPKTLSAAEPDGWLPFASNADLDSWRDFLVPQMEPGAALYTVEIYASRLAMSTEEFSENLDRAEWMEEHVFSRVELDSVLDLLSTAVGSSVNLIGNYLQVTG